MIKNDNSEFKQVSNGKKSLRIFGPQLACRIILSLLKIQNPSNEQLSIGVENAVPVTVLNKLIFPFNVDI